MTDKYAGLGNPIGHRKSPLVQGKFAQATGDNIEYTAILGALGRFVRTVDAFRASGGRGMNVTAPFKLDAFAYATDLSPRPCGRRGQRDEVRGPVRPRREF